MFTTKRTIIIAVAGVILGSVALAADQQPPYNYGASPSPATPAPTPQKEQPPAQMPDVPYRPKEEPKAEAKAKPKQQPKRKVAHLSGRRLFDYNLRFMNKDKLRRCMHDLPWKDIAREQSTPEKRREFCQTYQIEKWRADDTRIMERKLQEIFDAKPKPKPKPKPQQQDMFGY